MKTWYAKRSAGPGQGLVIEEETGRNVAVSYDEKDTPLLAAAPELLAALRDILAWVVYTRDGHAHVRCLRHAEQAVAEATRDLE